MKSTLKRESRRPRQKLQVLVVIGKPDSTSSMSASEAVYWARLYCVSTDWFAILSIFNHYFISMTLARG